MPLPPAPAKRAAFLNTEAIQTSAKTKSTRRTDEKVLPSEPVASAQSPKVLVAKTHAPVAPKARDNRHESESRRDEERQTAPLRSSTARTKKTKHTGPTKLFVLDTNVLMHDPMCLFN